jgi:glycogen(starch) synthase
LPAEATWRGASVHRFPLHSPVYRQDVARIAQVRVELAAHKREFAPDVVHVQLADGTVFFHALTRDAVDCATVVTVHSAVVAAEATPGTPSHQVLTTADWVTGCSGSMLDQVRRVVPDIVERSSVVLNGLDPTRLSPTPVPSEPLVLLIGRLTPEKGFDVALRACASVARDVSGLRVLLAGDGPERESLRALADELGIGEAVELLGPVASDDVGVLFERATVVALPSRYAEPFGLVALEAALAGRAVVASRVGGIPEVVLHGETGVLVPSDDTGALAIALGALLRDPGRAAALGLAARARAERDFTVGEHTAKFEVLFERLVAERVRAGA